MTIQTRIKFQKYGMLDGVVRTISPDSSAQGAQAEDDTGVPPGFAFKALVELDRQRLEANGLELPLAAGMQVTAEIKQGTRTVIEYLLSPVQRVVSDADAERLFSLVISDDGVLQYTGDRGVRELGEYTAEASRSGQRIARYVERITKSGDGRSDKADSAQSNCLQLRF
jgi:hypothetical protein